MGGEELYILKHKDLDTAMVKINPFSGRIEYILEVYLPEELPIGCKKDGTGLAEWWKSVFDAGSIWIKSDRSLLDAASFKRTVLERY